MTQGLVKKVSEVVNIQISGEYSLELDFTEADQRVGRYTAKSDFYLQRVTREIFASETSTYFAPLAWVDEPRLGRIPAAELEMRRQQLDYGIKLAKELGGLGITFTVTGKPVAEIEVILEEWAKLLKS